MANKIAEWNGHNIFEYEYDRWKGHEECNGLVGYGVAYKFHRWLVNNDLIDELTTVDDTYNNLSECRDGNRYDIHDNYILWDTDMEISFLYVVNGNVWATIEKDNGWYGDIEIGAV